MEDKNLPVIVLIIALIALCFSVYTFYSVIQVNKKMNEIEATVNKSSEVIAEFEKFIPEIDLLREFFPRMQQFLLSIPPVPADN